MQDFVRQEFDKSISDSEERELVLEFDNSDKFRTNLTQKKVNMIEIMYRWFFKNYQKLSKIIPFNKS